MTLSSPRRKCRGSAEEEKLNVCTWEKVTISLLLATLQTANALQGAVRHVDWERVRQFTVKSSKCSKSGKETEKYGRFL